MPGSVKVYEKVLITDLGLKKLTFIDWFTFILKSKTVFNLELLKFIVAHYQGLTVNQLDKLRAKMREHGIIFKIIG